MRTWTLRQRVVAQCVAVGVLLTALGIVAVFTATTSNDRIEDVLNRTGPMRADGESLITAMVDQETKQLRRQGVPPGSEIMIVMLVSRLITRFMLLLMMLAKASIVDDRMLV